MNLQNLISLKTSDYNEDQSMIKPVFMSQSNNPFYLVDRKNLINLDKPTKIKLRLDQNESNRVINSNLINRSNRNEKKTFLNILNENLGKTYLLIKSYNSSSEINRRLERMSRTRLNENKLKKIGIKLNELVMNLSKVKKTNTLTKRQDVNRVKRVDTLIDTRDKFKNKLKNNPNDRTIFKALFNRMTVDSEFNRILKLANFIEKNLQIIGLQPVYELFSFNRTSNFDRTFFQKLIKQIDDKLVQNGKFNSLTNSNRFRRRIDMNDEENLNEESSNENHSNEDYSNEDHSNEDHSNEDYSNEDHSNEDDLIEDNLNKDDLNEDSLEYSKIDRTDGDDVKDTDLLSELEDYIRSRRKIRMQKRMKQVLSNDDEDEDEDDYSQNLRWAKVKSRKRRSRKLNTKKSKNKKRKKLTHSKELKSDQFGKKRKKNRPKIKNFSRDYNLRNYEDENNESRDCNSSNESCEGSEIHEQYALPFSSAEDQQMSESYDDQSNRGEYNNEYKGNDYVDYNQPADQQNRYINEYSKQPDEQYGEDFKQQGNYRHGRLKSSVKYEGQINNERNEFGDLYDGNYNDNHMFEGDEFGYKQQFNPYVLTSDYDGWNAEHPVHDFHTIKSLKFLKHFKKHPPIHHIDHPFLNPHEPNHHRLPGPPFNPHNQLVEFHHTTDHHHHHKDDLTLTKELITKLLMDNKHKILAILKATKFTHLVFTKKFIAIAAQLFLGKGVYVKKKMLLTAYKKCYIKIRTVDMLLIPGK